MERHAAAVALGRLAEGYGLSERAEARREVPDRLVGEVAVGVGSEKGTIDPAALKVLEDLPGPRLARRGGAPLREEQRGDFSRDGRGGLRRVLVRQHGDRGPVVGEDDILGREAGDLAAM